MMKRDANRTTTALQRALAEDAPGQRRATVMDAFALARRRFHAAERVEMQELAEELGVNRATLYRWVGSREQLLTEILWAATSRSFDLYAGRPAEGMSRSAAALSAFVHDANAHEGMRTLLLGESEFALRLLTSGSSEYQQRYRGLVLDLIARDREHGAVSQEIPLEDLAYTAVRITESYIHTRAITGETPDARRAEVVLRVLLR